ncbi:hypothetical protein LOK49_LG06G02452 [Camellia lanceoleosa]|uniref:Uncharacterized protein n=1 Tax=Camellia lanceoleosa TaxID=1840588 RepID=A0ACC0HCE7_9ERIC|nr:hypothetical protein LOK49_LG06G02452 [Camellia lanceoleosa]
MIQGEETGEQECGSGEVVEKPTETIQEEFYWAVPEEHERREHQGRKEAARGHRQESCSDQQPLALAAQPQDRISNTIKKTIGQMGKSPTPDQERADSELGRPTYGPWMIVTNRRRKSKVPLINKGNKAQLGNKFHSLREKGGPVKDQGQPSRINEELGFRYKTNASPIVENTSHSSLATAKANNGKDIRLGTEV